MTPKKSGVSPEQANPLDPDLVEPVETVTPAPAAEGETSPPAQPVAEPVEAPVPQPAVTPAPLPHSSLETGEGEDLEPAVAEPRDAGSAAEAPRPEPVVEGIDARRAESFWARPGWLAVALVGLLSSCLGVFLTLGILGLVNRGLSYASPADVLALQAQVDTLETRVDGAAQDLAGLRARVEQLEELAARTTELERLALELQAEVDKRVAQAEELQGAVESMQTRIAEVVTQSKAFQGFVDGLRDLLNLLPGGQTP